MDTILLSGRWKSLAVARLYLQDGLAMLPTLRVPPSQICSRNPIYGLQSLNAMKKGSWKELVELFVKVIMKRSCPISMPLGSAVSRAVADLPCLLVAVRSLSNCHASWHFGFQFEM